MSETEIREERKFGLFGICFSNGRLHSRLLTDLINDICTQWLIGALNRSNRDNVLHSKSSKRKYQIIGGK